LEDGNAVIRNINILRNATCTPASFTPPTAKPARINGADAKMVMPQQPKLCNFDGSWLRCMSALSAFYV
jgi:hypothetical protein